jgi:hypothetical protein
MTDNISTEIAVVKADVGNLVVDPVPAAIPALAEHARAIHELAKCGGTPSAPAEQPENAEGFGVPFDDEIPWK